MGVGALALPSCTLRRGGEPTGGGGAAPVEAPVARASVESAGAVGPAPDPRPGPGVAAGSGPARATPVAEGGTPSPPWERWFVGVSGFEIERTAPRPMRGWAVRVESSEPGVEWVVTPSNGGREGETDGLRTSSFLEDFGCQVAVNAAPFSPLALFEGRGHDVKGLQVSAGDPVSPAGSNPWLAIGRDGRAAVAEAGSDGAEPWNAVAGFSVVLRDGAVLGSEGALHPRTAAGVSRDGTTVFLVVVDGRQDGFSEGASTADLGRLLLEIGAWDGINLDGGGTTTLVVEGSNGAPKTLNRPIHGGIPGLERVSASHLGVRARPLATQR